MPSALLAVDTSASLPTASLPTLRAHRSQPPIETPRPTVRGKYLYRGEEKLIVRGVTYGPFSSEPGAGFDPATAATDLASMREAEINAIRVYEPPPRWLLDLAQKHDLLVMVGVPWEQHVAFLDTGAARAIERRVRESVRACAGHPAVLCYAVGNEIPAAIVRWHGRRRVERFVARLCDAARDEDPGALVTYVNFPSTEYLRLPTLDLLSFNVYLERRELLERYLLRLQNLADDRPLLLAEVGLDSARNGEDVQADTLAWQLEAILQAGCAGAFVFSWTDQWHRGGYEIRDWDFGLTTRDRRPKLALCAVARAFSPERPRAGLSAPSFTVAICSHNGAATLRECLDGVLAQRYDDYEVIVVSDGSTDATARLAAEHTGVRVIETPARGLAAARNTAMSAARGEVIAYIDDDASPDPDWLSHLANAFASGPWAAAGGPNVPPPGSGAVAQCVANAPGGPTHVLVSDAEAEHVPGCNMAVRTEALKAIGGFDPQFHAAGDDVDACWRLMDSGRRIGFVPGAVVYHHRRSSVLGYLRQQRSYGKAEALLERKHPDKYGPAGHVDWAGQLYGNGAAQHRGGWRWRVYYGGWGTAFYQSIYGPRRGLLQSLPLMPEWYLAIAVLALLSAAGAAWSPLLLALPLLAVAVAAVVADAALGASRARFSAPAGNIRLRVLTGLLYLMQPPARLYGRLTHGLTPWRRRGPRMPSLPVTRNYSFWCEHWQGTEERVRAIIGRLRDEGSVTLSGGDWDRWDVEVRGGLLAGARLRMAIEEHGAGRQLVRVRCWPSAPRLSLALGTLAVALGVLGTLAHARGAALLALVFAGVVLGRLIYDCGLASASVRRVLRRTFSQADSPAVSDHAPVGERRTREPAGADGHLALVPMRFADAQAGDDAHDAAR
jgi:glycosyltransferase involved in cell wall biosynthesis